MRRWRTKRALMTITCRSQEMTSPPFIMARCRRGDASESVGGFTDLFQSIPAIERYTSRDNVSRRGKLVNTRKSAGTRVCYLESQQSRQSSSGSCSAILLWFTGLARLKMCPPSGIRRWRNTWVSFHPLTRTGSYRMSTGHSGRSAISPRIP